MKKTFKIYILCQKMLCCLINTLVFLKTFEKRLCDFRNFVTICKCFSFSNDNRNKIRAEIDS
jgi:hypothetical protein